jgi:2,4-dienoyl-CoA reductase-like NADH-dependent reductase (Old Yellow Enzyme family)
MSLKALHLTEPPMTTLFDPASAGALHLKNRIVMAPLTRQRAVGGRVPNTLMRDYYVQRASAGMILTEATSVTPMGVGYPDTPGIWNDAQVAGWRVITDAVHEAGGLIVLQLWHVGRISDPVFLDGALPVSASAIAAAGTVSHVRPVRPFVTPRALDISEIPGIVEAYRQAAANAKRAGFDGVEVHGANGYLLDQFLQDGSNKRTDAYGGLIENRARFHLEVTDAVIGEWGADRVGMHLNLSARSQSVTDSNRAALFPYMAAELDRRGLAFLVARESLAEPEPVFSLVRQAFRGFLIANDGLTPESGAALVESGRADAACFGRLFIANPDLPARLRAGAALNPLRPDVIYTPGAEGYTDYPALAPAVAAI